MTIARVSDERAARCGLEEQLAEAGLSEREVRASLERLLRRIDVTLDERKEPAHG